MKQVIPVSLAIAFCSLSNTSAYNDNDVAYSFLGPMMELNQGHTPMMLPTVGLYYLFKDGVFCECADDASPSERNVLALQEEEPELFGTWKKTLSGFELEYSDGEVEMLTLDDIEPVSGF